MNIAKIAEELHKSRPEFSIDFLENVAKSWIDAKVGIIKLSECKIISTYNFNRQRHAWVESKLGIGWWNDKIRCILNLEDGSQAVVYNDMSVDRVVFREEQKFLSLMEKNKDWLGKRVSAKEAFDLFTSKGVHPDLLDVSNIAELTELLDEHRDKSKNKKFNFLDTKK